MIAKDIATQKNDSQKLADISSNESSNKVMSNELWCELNETSEAAVSGGSESIFATNIINTTISNTTISIINTKFSGTKASF
jgi:hypothetical protein